MQFLKTVCLIIDVDSRRVQYFTKTISKIRMKTWFQRAKVGKMDFFPYSELATYQYKLVGW